MYFYVGFFLFIFSITILRWWNSSMRFENCYNCLDKIWHNFCIHLNFEGLLCLLVCNFHIKYRVDSYESFYDLLVRGVWIMNGSIWMNFQTTVPYIMYFMVHIFIFSISKKFVVLLYSHNLFGIVQPIVYSWNYSKNDIRFARLNLSMR